MAYVGIFQPSGWSTADLHGLGHLAHSISLSLGNSWKRLPSVHATETLVCYWQASKIDVFFGGTTIQDQVIITVSIVLHLPYLTETCPSKLTWARSVFRTWFWVLLYGVNFLVSFRTVDPSIKDHCQDSFVFLPSGHFMQVEVFTRTCLWRPLWPIRVWTMV